MSQGSKGPSSTNKTTRLFQKATAALRIKKGWKLLSAPCVPENGLCEDKALQRTAA